MADDYRSFCGERKGPGEYKSTSLKSFGEWDAPLHPDITIHEYSLDNDEWKIKFNEENDFSKLIGFPGWGATERITLDDKGKILESIYIPDKDQPNYKEWLHPAVVWLQEHMADSLQTVYQNGKLNKSEVTAGE